MKQVVVWKTYVEGLLDLENLADLVEPVLAERLRPPLQAIHLAGRRPFISRAALSRSPSSRYVWVRVRMLSTSSPVARPCFLKSTLLRTQLEAWLATPASSGSRDAFRTSVATRRKRSISSDDEGMPRWYAEGLMEAIAASTTGSSAGDLLQRDELLDERPGGVLNPRDWPVPPQPQRGAAASGGSCR